MEEKKYYLTPNGLQKYKEEYERLKKIRKEKKTEIKETRDELWRPEDLNPDYEALQTELNSIERKLNTIEDVLKHAKLIRPQSKPSRKVILGSKVTVEVEKQIDEFTIVGTMETNPSQGKISNESPVGKALLGRKVGEEVVISSPIKVAYKIKKIE